MLWLRSGLRRRVVAGAAQAGPDQRTTGLGRSGGAGDMACIGSSGLRRGHEPQDGTWPVGRELVAASGGDGRVAGGLGR